MALLTRRLVCRMTITALLGRRLTVRLGLPLDSVKRILILLLEAIGVVTVPVRVRRPSMPILVSFVVLVRRRLRATSVIPW